LRPYRRLSGAFKLKAPLFWSAANCRSFRFQSSVQAVSVRNLGNVGKQGMITHRTVF
jgi:hypothetical protein